MIPLATARATVLEELERAGDQLLSDLAQAVAEEYGLDFAQVREVITDIADADEIARRVAEGVDMGCSAWTEALLGGQAN